MNIRRRAGENRHRKASNETGGGSAQGVEGTANAPKVCALEVGETVECVEESVVTTTATKGGQRNEVLDRITGQRSGSSC